VERPGALLRAAERVSVYAFGIKAQSLAERYAKFRGVTLAGIYNDQTEELPEDIFEELVGRLSQPRYPHQILLTPNPMEEDSWLARRFPEDDHITHRHYYSASLFDNAHNLDEDTIERLQRVYPPAHVKHRPMILGKRGMNVIGQPVYGAVDPHEPQSAAFHRHRHERPLDAGSQPAAARSHRLRQAPSVRRLGAVHAVGGLTGARRHHGAEPLPEDFAPIVQQYRQRWFPNALEVRPAATRPARTTTRKE
jgi:hypothetical protein